MFDHNKFIDLGTQLREEYENSDPFPHIVLDNFLPLDIAEKCHDSYPLFEEMDSKTFQTKENKIASRPNANDFPDYLRQVLYSLNSHEIITFLELLTGINGIVADPHFLGGGLHQTRSGGKLGIHVDFNYHKHLRLNRRINLIYFLNKNWKDEYGGDLELWDKDMKNCIKKVSPVFNRAVIFNTTDISYHGHPDPLTCPDNVFRKSIALYYYTSGRPEDDAKEVFWTEHQKRPDKFDYFFDTKETSSEDKSSSLKNTLKSSLREITPPVLWKALKKLR